MKWVSRGLRVGLLGCIGAQGDVALPNQHLTAGTMDAAICSSTADSSAALVQRIRDGDGSAEDELVGLYLHGVFLIAVARTRDRETARDLSQETFIAVLQALRRGQLRESNKLAAFIQGITRNVINNHIRARSRRAECELIESDSPSVDPADAFELAVRRRLVRQELQAFSDTDRQILLLSFEGHSLAEIAIRLRLSHEAVRARKSRMIKKIAKKFEGVSHK